MIPSRDFQPVLFTTNDIIQEVLFKTNTISTLFNYSSLSKILNQDRIEKLLLLNHQETVKNYFFPETSEYLNLPSVEGFMKLWFPDNEVTIDFRYSKALLESSFKQEVLEELIDDTQRYSVYHDENIVLVSFIPNLINILSLTDTQRLYILKDIVKTYYLYHPVRSVSTNQWFKCYLGYLLSREN